MFQLINYVYNGSE